MPCRKSNDFPKISVNTLGLFPPLALNFCFTQLFHLSLTPENVRCPLFFLSGQNLVHSPQLPLKSLTHGFSCLWNSSVAVERAKWTSSSQTESNTPFVSWPPGAQRDFHWFPFSVGTRAFTFGVFFLPQDSPHVSLPLAFLVPSEAPFTPIYYADQFHRIKNLILSPFPAQKTWQRIQSFSFFVFWVFPFCK